MTLLVNKLHEWLYGNTFQWLILNGSDIELQERELSYQSNLQIGE